MLLLAEVADQLKKARPEILQRWRARVTKDPQINASARLSRAQFNDHIPVLLKTFGERLRHGDSPEQNEDEREVSEAHGRHRWQQGYDLRGMVREWGHLNVVLVEWLDENHAPQEARALWAKFLAFNEADAVALYEELLQSEARAKLADVERALEELQSWEKARGDVLRGASHDLRSSLSIVTTASTLIGHKGASDEQREQIIELLASGVKNLMNMMNDLLDMSRIEAGIEMRETHHMDAGVLLWELCMSWRSLAEQKGLGFEADGPKTLRVEGDTNKVRRIAQNLVLNAIKYTEQGQVTVTWGEDSDKLWFLKIADTGKGLEQSNAAPLAEELESAAPDAPPSDFAEQAPNTSSLGGEGIGLSIVRRLCAIVDASIELNSTEAGSTFYITFPRDY